MCSGFCYGVMMCSGDLSGVLKGCKGSVESRVLLDCSTEFEGLVVASMCLGSCSGVLLCSEDCRGVLLF